MYWKKKKNSSHLVICYSKLAVTSSCVIGFCFFFSLLFLICSPFFHTLVTPKMLHFPSSCCAKKKKKKTKTFNRMHCVCIIIIQLIYFFRRNILFRLVLNFFNLNWSILKTKRIFVCECKTPFGYTQKNMRENQMQKLKYLKEKKKKKSPKYWCSSTCNTND